MSERHISEPATVSLFELKKKTSKKIPPPKKKKTNDWKPPPRFGLKTPQIWGCLLGGENGSDRNDRDRKLGDWKAYLGDELQPTYRG